MNKDCIYIDILYSGMQSKIIEQTEVFVKDFMKVYDCSHDFNHVIRVKNMSIEIAKSEQMTDDELFEIQLGALTHDVGDHKYSNGNMTQEEILTEFFKDKLNADIMNNVIKIAVNVSLSKETTMTEKIECKKLYCVQDADRLDSLGALGISRYFAYGLLQNKSSIDEIFKNIENRSSILMQHIKTKYGKEKAENKIELIRLLIKDYKNSI